MSVENIAAFSEKIKTVKKLDEKDAQGYSDEFDIPIEYVSEIIKLELFGRRCRYRAKESEIKQELIQIELERLRLDSDHYIKEATKSANSSMSKMKQETKRADDAERELADKSRQLEKVVSVLRNKSTGISEIDIFFTGINGTSKSFRNAILKALHPDKHQDVDEDTMKGITEFFRIINDMIS